MTFSFLHINSCVDCRIQTYIMGIYVLETLECIRIGFDKDVLHTYMLFNLINIYQLLMLFNGETQHISAKV